MGMNIALLSSEYPPETNWGGMATYSYTMAHGLVNAGHRVWVICRSSSVEECVLDDEGVTVCRVQARPLRAPIVGRIACRYFPGAVDIIRYSARVAEAVADIHARSGLDLVESREWRAESVYVKKRTRLPVAVRLAYPQFMERRLYGGRWSFNCWMIERLERSTIMRADALFSPSAAMARIAEREYGLPDSSIRVVPHPADARTFAPVQTTAEQYGVLYAGRLEPKKGVETLVRAIPIILEAHPSALFTLVGADTNRAVGGRSTKAYLQEVLAEQDVPVDRVCFIPSVSRDELSRYYNGAQVVVVPSWFEAFGFVALEAMACSRPVVAADVGGLAETVEHGFSGYLFPARDHQALAGYVSKLLGCEELREQMGANGYALTRTRNSIEVILERNMRLFGGVVEQFRSTEGKSVKGQRR